MTQVDGGLAECDGCGRSLEGNLTDSILIHRANYDLGRVEMLHLCLDQDGDEGCATKLLTDKLLKHYSSKEDNKLKRQRPAHTKKQSMPRKKASAKKKTAKR